MVFRAASIAKEPALEKPMQSSQKLFFFFFLFLKKLEF